MSMRTFIRKNRAEIDATIRSVCSGLGRLTNEDREDWILNDESLYLWAKAEGVPV